MSRFASSCRFSSLEYFRFVSGISIVYEPNEHNRVLELKLLKDAMSVIGSSGAIPFRCGEPWLKFHFHAWDPQDA